MKKGVLMLVIAVAMLSSFVYAADCSLDVSMINQDPYPAVPGDYVKLVFQVNGMGDPACGVVDFQLLPGFPISFDPGTNSSIKLNSGAYAVDYSSYATVPFKVRVDKDAIDGDNTIKVAYAHNSQNGEGVYLRKDFNLAVNNSQGDFEVIVDSYSYATGQLTLGILNTGKSNARSLTVKLLDSNVLISGGNEKIIGDLNSNDDTTINFNAIPNGDNLKVVLSYNDINNARRSIDKDVYFSSQSFESTKNTGSGKGASYYLLILTWLVIIAVFVYKYFRNKKAKKIEQQKRFR